MLNKQIAVYKDTSSVDVFLADGKIVAFLSPVVYYFKDLLKSGNRAPDIRFFLQIVVIYAS